MGLNKRKLGMQYGFEAYFRNQDRTPKGKVGIVFGHMGVPEDYEFDFYSIYMTHLFKSILPPLIAGIVLKDTGTVLSDPNNPVPEEEFKPQVLMDAYGSYKNKKGIPYVDCQVKWVPPKKGKSHDNGYFLYQGKGKTTDIYLGVPVGERYRPYVAQGIFDSVSSILDFKERHQIGY